METGEIAFKAGKTYEFKGSDGSWVGASEIDKNHYMEDDDIEMLRSGKTVVWILVNLENGWDNIIGVFSSEEKATDEQEMLGDSDQFMIFEREVE